MSGTATTSHFYRCHSFHQAQLTVKGKNSQGIGRLKFGEGRTLMLKIIYPNCCGIDVHKTFVVAVIAITDKQGITSYHRKLLQMD